MSFSNGLAPPEEPQPEEQMGEIVTPEEEGAQIRNVQPTTPVATSYTKTYTYDLANNRTGMTVTKGGSTVQNVTYTSR